MRIGLLIYGSLETLSGGYLYDRKLVEYLRAQGDKVEIISIPWRSYPLHLTDNFSAGLQARLERLEVDVLLQDELNHPSLFWLNKKLDLPYPVISIVHHLRCSELRPGWQNQLYARVERHYLQSVDGFIFNSQSTRQSVEAQGIDLGRRPWVVAYPAGSRFEKQPTPGAAPILTDPEILRRASEPGPLRLVFAGSLIARKGLHTLLDALATIPAGLCELDIAGSPNADPAYARRVRQQVQWLGLKKTVRFHGALADAALSALFAQAQVMVTPSSYEGFGIVYLEGMSFGLPAIASTAGAAHELITPDENGFLIKPESSTELALHLHNLAKDRPMLGRMGLAARRRYESFPSWEQSAAQIREFLTSTNAV